MTPIMDEAEIIREDRETLDQGGRRRGDAWRREDSLALLAFLAGAALIYLATRGYHGQPIIPSGPCVPIVVHLEGVDHVVSAVRVQELRFPDGTVSALPSQGNRDYYLLTKYNNVTIVRHLTKGGRLLGDQFYFPD